MRPLCPFVRPRDRSIVRLPRLLPVPIGGRVKGELRALLGSASLGGGDRLRVRRRVVVDPGPRAVDLRVTPPTERHRDLVGARLPVVLGVLEVVFLQERSGVLTGQPPFPEPTPATLAGRIRGAELRTVRPLPLAVRVRGRTPELLGVAFARKRRVLVAVLGGVPTAPVVGQKITPIDDGVGVVDADRRALRRPLHVVASSPRYLKYSATGRTAVGAPAATRYADTIPAPPSGMDTAAVRSRASALPAEPGVYQFEAGDRVLYVGKAVDIRDRVRSYADPRSERIRRMVDSAARIDFAVTDTETQALLLEANLIKRHQPRYNVRLKDDKSYPLVAITDHEVPRIEITRDPGEGATVFGPFTDKGRVETVLKAVRRIYGLRGCSDYKYEGRERPCLDYEMGLCTAPCTDEISPPDYRDDVESAVRFLEGETGVLAEPLRRRMGAAAEEQSFERAAALRDELDAVEAFHGGGGEAVAGRTEELVDVLGVAIEGGAATVARLHSEDGKLVDRDRHRLDAPEEGAGVAAVLAAFVPQFYADRPLPDALLLPERYDDRDLDRWLDAEGVAVRVPGAGREATLVELAIKNASRRGGDSDGSAELARRLGVDRIDRIEGFDVSHTGGRAVVGSNVRFVDGDPEKSGYRRKTLTETNDDYANMRTLLRWRAERAIEGRDDRSDPDLLLIDGGSGQRNAACKALDTAGWDVPVVALAKAEERVITADGSREWSDDDPALHLLQRVRDEAHRFAVQYHQTVRDSVSTPLDEVPGVGPELRKRLLGRFGSVDGVRAASPSELEAVDGVGSETAAAIDRAL